jgi:hypothetical protein
MSDDKPDDVPSKADKLADEALQAGRKFLETDTGKKVGEMTDTAFEKAGELRKKAVESEFGRQALESDLGRQAVDFAKSANEQAKQAIPNQLGRNVAIGAAAGAVMAIPLPFIGPILGAIVGGGLGYLRTITKKR